MSLNIRDLSLLELRNLRDQVDQAIAERKQEELDKLRAEIAAMIGARGFSIQQVLEAEQKQKKIAAQKPRTSSQQTGEYARGKVYHHPEDPSRQWVCNGKRPAWVSDLVSKGVRLIEVRPH